jgi:hypothetical protein
VKNESDVTQERPKAEGIYQLIPTSIAHINVVQSANFQLKDPLSLPERDCGIPALTARISSWQIGEVHTLEAKDERWTTSNKAREAGHERMIPLDHGQQ